MRALTLYEVFARFTEEQVNDALKKLNPEDIELLKLKYGEDFKHPRSVSRKINNKVRAIVIIIEKCLADPTYIPVRRPKKPVQNKLEKNKEERSTSFTWINDDLLRLISFMTIDEFMLILSRIEALARLSNKSELEILELKKSYMELYKESINSSISLEISSIEEEENKRTIK